MSVAPDPINALREQHCNATEDGATSEICPDNGASGSNAAPSDSPTGDFEFLDSSEETLYYRYGFKPTTSASLSTLDLTLATVSRILGDPQWGEKSVIDPSSGRNIKGDVSAFLGHLSRAKTLQDIPAELYDLRRQGVAALRPSPIQLRWEVIKFKTYYFLTPKIPVPDGTPESIVLRSAASAMDILRRDWTTLEQVAVNLVARGIAFNTFRRAPPPIFPLIQPPVQPYRGLGYRPQDFRTDAGEYAGYEAIRNRIFCSGRGRAALMMGGIIARLARDVVALQSVYRGPTKTVSVDGQCVWDGHPSAPAYWDDALTAEELEIICGVYEVATGVSDPNREGGQTRCGSWWPLPAAWSLSGLDMGHWTPSCETWFQRRLAQNRGGDGLLQTHTQWKHNLAFERKGAPLSHNNERLAEEFLAENGTRIARDPQAQQFPRAIRSQGPGSETPSDGFYFALRTQEPKSAASDSADIEPVISSSLPDVQLPPQVKQPLKPEVQQATRQYWDTRRKISSALLRGRVIEQRLRALHVKNPQDIYLNSSELAERFRRVETELAEERRRTREVEKTVGDIQRECKTPTVVPTLLWVATIEE